jgi:uncharacterized protein (DUF427 family)
VTSIPEVESVWDYPRPRRLERTDAHVVVMFADRVLVDTRRALRVLETSHPPAYYLPLADFAPGVLTGSPHTSLGEFKGSASYVTLESGNRRSEDAGWYYPQPAAGYELLADHVALYPERVDACFVDDEQVQPQPGDFYGGWITSRVAGPFKGGPGTSGW